MERRRSEMQMVKRKIEREDLFEEIFHTVRQWPDLEWKVFARAHYYGQSPGVISRSLHLDTEAVSAILKRCDRHLQTSLRKFRRRSYEDPSLTPARATGMTASP
jgi:DNA-directed RNA polymerase specialized sigma24 family protein